MTAHATAAPSGNPANARTVFGGLKPGPHHVEIQALGRRNSASSGSFIDIDAIIGR